jgi:gas vesicle protein
MWKDEKEYKHESFGLLQINRNQTMPPVKLFGSSIKTTQTVVLRVKHAREIRDQSLSNSWFFDDCSPALIEIEMTESQFAEAITSLNIGSGTPVTIRYVNGSEMEPPPNIDRRDQYHNEFKKTVEQAFSTADELKKEANSILNQKGSIKVAEKEKLRGLIGALISTVKSHVPWIVNQWNEQMDKTTTEAKQEVDQMFRSAVRSVGERAIAGGAKIELPRICPDVEE